MKTTKQSLDAIRDINDMFLNNWTASAMFLVAEKHGIDKWKLNKLLKDYQKLVNN